MALKDTISWARSEWGILSKGREMSWADRGRWLQQWVPFGLRTIGYGTFSVTVGPFTRGAASTWAARRWSRVCLDALNITVEVGGLEHVPAGGFVYASNHQSLVDILVLGAALPGDFKWAAKRSVMNVPFLGWHLRLAGHVPVDRTKDKQTAMAVTQAFERVLRDGQPLLVFPEGTRTADGQVKAFKDGGFFAAVRAERPVVPVAIEGTFTLMSRHEEHTGELSDGRRPRRVAVQIGQPIHPDPELCEADRVADLRDRTRAAVVALHSRLTPLAN